MKKQSQKFNSLPTIFFTPFKTSRKSTIFFLVLSMILSIILMFHVIDGSISFNQEQLKDIADFSLNLIFVVAALGLTIFTLPISAVHPSKEKILFSYIGNSFVLASIAILTYIISYCDFLNVSIANSKVSIFSLYFCVMLFILCGCIIQLLTTVIAYFNIRE